MTNQQREKSLKNMSKYLLQGAEMLKDSCPNCNVPLLRLKDKIFCGGCNKEVIFTTEESFNEIQDKLTNETESKNILSTAEIILLGKLENITNLVINQQKEELKQSLEIMEKILALLQQLKQFKK